MSDTGWIFPVRLVCVVLVKSISESELGVDLYSIVGIVTVNGLDSQGIVSW